jgi:hypothetical protein
VLGIEPELERERRVDLRRLVRMALWAHRDGKGFSIRLDGLVRPIATVPRAP